jgi:hypothetical protein
MERSTKFFIEFGISFLIAISVIIIIILVRTSDTNQYSASNLKEQTETIYNKVDTIDLKHNFTAEMIYELKVGQEKIDSVLSENTNTLNEIASGQKSTQTRLNKIFYNKNK